MFNVQIFVDVQCSPAYSMEKRNPQKIGSIFWMDHTYGMHIHVGPL